MKKRNFLALAMSCCILFGQIVWAHGVQESTEKNIIVPETEETALEDNGAALQNESLIVTNNSDPSNESLAEAKFDGGTGTVNDPYLISNVTQLRAVNDNLDASYKLCSDIDLADEKIGYRLVVTLSR